MLEKTENDLNRGRGCSLLTSYIQGHSFSFYHVKTQSRFDWMNLSISGLGGVHPRFSSTYATRILIPGEVMSPYQLSNRGLGIKQLGFGLRGKYYSENWILSTYLGEKEAYLVLAASRVFRCSINWSHYKNKCWCLVWEPVLATWIVTSIMPIYSWRHKNNRCILAGCLL